MHDFVSILWISMIAGLATTMGSLFVVMFGNPEERTLALFLAGAGGVMLAVVFIDLLPNAILIGPLWQTILGAAAGLSLMFSAGLYLKGSRSTSGNRAQQLKGIGFLVAAGIALHDLPEGMAISIGQEAAAQLGILIAIAIALHNFPEGMATATPLKMAKVSPWKIILLNSGIAVFTPLGALIGMAAVGLVKNSLAFFLALAAGAMIYLVFAELIPLSREHQPHWALFGLALGFFLFTLINLIHIA